MGLQPASPLSLPDQLSTLAFNTRNSKVSWKQVLVAFKDPKCWGFALINGGFGQASSTVSIFLPSFIAEFGFDDLDAQLFSVIPYAVAFVSLLSLAYLSDRVNLKGPFIIGCLATASLGYILLLTVSSTGAKIFATCCVVGGVYPGVVLATVWLGINTAGFTKRGTVWSMAEMVAQAFSIMGTNVYKSSSTSHSKGHWVTLAFLLAAMAIANNSFSSGFLMPTRSGTGS